MTARVELHRPFDIVSLPEGGRLIDITATEQECAAIAAHIGLLALAGFRAVGRLDPVRRGRSALFEARLTAAVTQACIITLDPVEASIDETISVRLLTEDEADKRLEEDIDVDEDDLEVAHEGIVDLGDIAVQYLALALDPYPRRPDAEGPPEPQDEDDEDNTPSNPFAVLKKLKDKT